MLTRNNAASVPDPLLAPNLVEAVLSKLGLQKRPSLDLAGLNSVFAAVSGKIPFDNVRKRIWFAGPQIGPLPGGDPTEFFSNWLRHGTGGTCWPLNGGVYALLRTLGFDARRIVGSVIVEGYPQGANHGSILVTLDGTDYVADAWMASFKALPLAPGRPTSTGGGIHDIRSVPTGNAFEILSYAGWLREQPLPFRIEPEYDPVDHAFFLDRAERTKVVGFFNDAVFISRHFPDSILTLGRHSKFRVAADGSLTKTQPSGTERKAALVEEFGLSEEIVDAIPTDVSGGVAPPGL
ncbi:MAG TPA: arylamine N-acetyltransferase [Candidatus Acidoferrales bacterium]|nr:arylamine N-acetyltransferase [Candidatus Acidoferrales bacterium]